MRVRIWVPVLPAAILLVFISVTSPTRSDTPTRDSVRPPASEGLPVAAPGVTSPAGAENVASGIQGAFRLQGEIHTPNGAPYTRTVALQFLKLDPFPSTLVYTTVVASAGQFDVVLPEGLYWLGTEYDLSPFYMPRTNIDLHSAVLGKVIVLLNQREAPVGEAPPDASLITVSPPDVDGFATVTGASGAVPPFSAVAVVNLNAAAAAAAVANARGAFTTTTLYAPPGSPLLV